MGFEELQQKYYQLQAQGLMGYGQSAAGSLAIMSYPYPGKAGCAPSQLNQQEEHNPLLLLEDET